MQRERGFYTFSRKKVLTRCLPTVPSLYNLPRITHYPQADGLDNDQRAENIVAMFTTILLPKK
jgi:hypothetical protein